MKHVLITLGFLVLALLSYSLGFDGSRPLAWLCILLGFGFEIAFWFNLLGRRSRESESGG